MKLGLREELIEAGVAAAGDALHEIRLEDGPAGLRGSCLVASGHVWLEAGPAGVDGGQRRAVRAIGALASRHAPLRDIAAVPYVTNAGTAVYGALTTSQLMIDGLTPSLHGADPAGWPTWIDDCRLLGSVLACLHDTAPGGARARGLLRDDPALARVASVSARGGPSPPANLALERLRDHLLFDHPVLSTLAGRARAVGASTTNGAPLHGRFSPSFVMRDSATGHGGPHVIGWLDAGYGPPAWDLGWFVGELHQIAAMWAQADPERVATIWRGGEALLASYVRHRSQPVPSAVIEDVGLYGAVSIVHQLWQTASFVGYDHASVRPAADRRRACVAARLARRARRRGAQMSPLPRAEFPIRRLLLGASGSIACAILPAWVSFMRESLGLEVRVLLTRRAELLVSAATLGALSGHPVALDRDDPATLATVPHQELADWPEAILVAPATANVIARLAAGMADDLLTTVVLAAECPVVLAPAMALPMLSKPATVRNLDTVRRDGCGIVPVHDGFAASAGASRGGAMADAPVALAYLKRFLAQAAKEVAA